MHEIVKCLGFASLKWKEQKTPALGMSQWRLQLGEAMPELTAIVIHCNVHTVKPAFRTLIIRIRRIRAWQ